MIEPERGWGRGSIMGGELIEAEATSIRQSIHLYFLPPLLERRHTPEAQLAVPLLPY